MTVYDAYFLSGGRAANGYRDTCRIGLKTSSGIERKHSMWKKRAGYYSNSESVSISSLQEIPLRETINNDIGYCDDLSLRLFCGKKMISKEFEDISRSSFVLFRTIYITFSFF